jgi:N-acetylglucosaminyldiphosphoundecaprenol N-acetyl-beta-D-mannosaminyltransferase
VKTVSILGYPVHLILRDELNELVKKTIAAKIQFHLTFPNTEHILYYCNNPKIQHYIHTSLVNATDGSGLIWASHQLKKQNQGNVIEERTTGTQFSYDIPKICAENNWKLCIYGGTKDSNTKAVQNIQIKYPSLKILGINGWEFNEEEVISQIQVFKPEALMVCLYNGMQEPWIERNHPKLPHTFLAYGAGGAVDFLAGNVKRAPEWMHRFGNVGFEWVWRLFQNFSLKHIKKTFQIPWFMILVLKQKYFGN